MTEDEIEITPEMIEAARRVWNACGESRGGPVLFPAIYRAMRALESSPTHDFTIDRLGQAYCKICLRPESVLLRQYSRCPGPRRKDRERG